MAKMLIRHKIADYDKWKPLFDAHGPSRAAAGLRGGWLMRNVDDPQELLIVFKTDDVDAARRFAESPDLRAVMQEAGVIGKPDIFFLEKIEEFKE